MKFITKHEHFDLKSLKDRLRNVKMCLQQRVNYIKDTMTAVYQHQCDETKMKPLQ